MLAAAPQRPPALRVVWRAAVNDGGVPPQGLPAADRRGWFGAAGQATAWDRSGRVLWRQPLHYLPRSLLLAGGDVVAVEASVSAWQAATGRLAWRFRPRANASLCEAAVGGGRVFFADAEGNAYALEAADGRLLWRVALPGAAAPVSIRGVALARGRLYAAGEERLGPTSARAWLFALSARDGEVLWRTAVGGAGQRRGFGAAPTVAGRLVLASDTLGNSIVAFDLSGRRRWVFRGARGYAGFPEPPLVRRGIVFAGSGDGFAYALRLDDGTPVWKRRVGGSVLGYALCGHALVLNDTELIALDPGSGRTLGKLFSDGAEFASSGVAVRRNRAFVLGPRAAYELSCS